MDGPPVTSFRRQLYPGYKARRPTFAERRAAHRRRFLEGFDVPDCVVVEWPGMALLPWLRPGGPGPR